MAQNRPKRLRWQSVIHEGGVSLDGLHGLIQKIGGEVVGRRTLAAANHLALEGCLHRETIPLLSGGEFVWEIANPNLLLQQTLSESSALQAAYGRAARRFPPTSGSP